MAYGIEITNNNSKLQISSDNAKVVAALAIVGQGTAIPGNTGTTYGPVSVDPRTEFLAFNRTTAGFIRGSHDTDDDDPDNNTTWTVENNSASNYGNINWIRVKRGSLITSGTTSGYGVNVYNSASGDLSFSSTWDEGIDILQVIEPNKVGSIQTANPSYTNTSAAMPGNEIYDNSIYGGSSPSDLSNVYFAPGKMIFNTIFSGSTQLGGRRMGTFKVESNGDVKAEGLWSDSLGGARFRVREVNSSSYLILKRRV